MNCFPNKHNTYTIDKNNEKIRFLPLPLLHARSGRFSNCSDDLDILQLFSPLWRKASGFFPGKCLALHAMCEKARGIFAGTIAISICMFAIFCFVNNGFCEEDLPSPETAAPSTAVVEEPETTDSKMWEKIWGQKSRDAILLGMWSIHLKGSGEYFGGSGESNEQNHLLGIIYNGIGAGTFLNSHDDRSWIIAVGRDVYSRQLSENTRFDMGYRLGPLYGYGDSLPNIGKVSVFAAGTFSFTWYNLGIDIMVIPIGVVTGGFRIDF